MSPEDVAQLYRNNRAVVLAYLSRRTREPELAADLMGEVFAQALLELDSFDSERGSHAAWLLAIARSKLIDTHRRGQVEDRARRVLGIPRLEFEDRDLERVTAAEGEALAALDELPISERAAVRARIVDEKTYAELASELHCSPLVARKRVSRGLQRLRTRLEVRP